MLNDKAADTEFKCSHGGQEARLCSTSETDQSFLLLFIMTQHIFLKYNQETIYRLREM